jgi:hypothetical protein
MEYVKPRYISLKNSTEFNEKWIQELISEDPGILGLGTLSLVSREKKMPTGGRVDLILGDNDDSARYEVEIQLGRTDPSHIIRVLEYWDLEKRRNPEFDHIAVLVAEEITARYFNVISLFNGAVPIIALQMKCVEAGGKVTIVFSKILDLMARGQDREIVPKAGRIKDGQWEKEAGREIVTLVKDVLTTVNRQPDIDGKARLVPRKQHAMIVHEDRTIAYCIPRKKYLTVSVQLSRSTEMDKFLADSGLDVMAYNTRVGRYRVRLYPNKENDMTSLMALIVAGMSGDELT